MEREDVVRPVADVNRRHVPVGDGEAQCSEGVARVRVVSTHGLCDDQGPSHVFGQGRCHAEDGGHASEYGARVQGAEDDDRRFFAGCGVRDSDRSGETVAAVEILLCGGAVEPLHLVIDLVREPALGPGHLGLRGAGGSFGHGGSLASGTQSERGQRRHSMCDVLIHAG
ncbi:hypothetical protein DMY01_00105 [Cutibacterium avidum]|uniref:Uncharacterized protein n=1 Tax=Cutibacterium avidum TaxID=33010 RepID=A0A3E2DN13_9ACTN|nr:hypothetical protein CHT91_00100 [Cutibacterium avidum]TMT55714.1 hypothetical protein DMY01_00105 [Cutibacterium avidum]